MTTRRLSTCGLAAAGVLALSSLVLGQGFNAKAGLWETTAQSTVGGSPDMAGMKGDASKMTPEQAAAMAMASNRGRGGARPVTNRKCWTQEQIAKQQFHEKDLDESCKQTTISKSATALELKVECTGERPSTGTLHLTSIDSEHVTGTFALKMTGGQMAGINVNSTFTSKWIGADCGDVK